MSATPFSSEEKDPTCVVKMLESLTRRNQRVGLGLLPGLGLGLSGNSDSSTSLGVGLGLGRRRGSAVATRLQFDESMNLGNPKGLGNRKRFMDNPTEGESRPMPLSLSTGLRTSVEKKFKFENTDPSNAIVPASPWEFRLMKADLLSSKSQIEVLENRNQQLHSLRREQELVFESEKAGLQIQHEVDVNRIKDLESRMEILKKRRYECKDELEEVKAKLISFNNDSGTNTRALERTVAELTDQLRESELKIQKNAAAESQRRAQLEIKLASATEVATQYEQQVAELTTKLQEARREQSEVEVLTQQLQERELRIKSLESEREEAREAVALATSEREKLLRFPETERELGRAREECARLRGLVRNTLFLEEQVANLGARLRGADERDGEAATARADLARLEAAHRGWLALAADLGGPGVRGPAPLRLRFQQLQQTELQLTADLADVKSRLKAALEVKNSTVGKWESLKTQFEKQKVINDQQTNLLHRQRKRLTLVSQERDYYRTQLDTYEKELTISTTTALPTSSQQDQDRSRIALLEKALQSYHELVEKLESDNAKEKNIGGPIELTEKDSGLEEEKDKLKKENEVLKRKQAELQLELMYRSLQSNPTNTKILHFRNNPRSEAESKRGDELFALRAECKKLQERIRVLSDGQLKDVTLVVEENVKSTNSKEVEGLQDQVNSYIVKIQRLKEAFKKTSNEFREIVYQVLGYRIDWKNSNEYHLSSMYAESADDVLVFQYNCESGDVNMLETSFSKTLKNLMHLHLRVQKSIPVFLSAVTIDLFSQQTMATITEPITLIE